MRHSGKIRIGDVAEQVFVRAVKVAGVDVAVAFRNELVRAMPCHAALLWLLPEVYTHEVVKFPHTDILSAHIVLDIQVEHADQKIGVLRACHIKLAFLIGAERPQAGDELQIPEAFLAEKPVDTLAVFGAVAGEHRKNVKFRAVFSENGGSVHDLIKRVLPRGLFAEFVAVKIAVQAQPRKEIVLCEKTRPRIIDLRAVGLDAVKYGAVFFVFLPHRAHKMLKIRKTGQCRFTALKGERHAFAVRKGQRLFDQTFRRFRRHNAEAEVFAVFGNIAVKAVFAA